MGFRLFRGPERPRWISERPRKDSSLENVLVAEPPHTPYLPPQPVRGQPNEPAHVVHTVIALAAARGEDADELAARIEANASAAFSLP